MTADVTLAVAATSTAAILYLAALAYAARRILRTPELGLTGRVLWIAAVVFCPVVAAIVWFTAGPVPLTAVLRLSRR
ncbi:hypothetical protein L1277_001402 [Okibacterium sp. HSC-33S16]|uniref:PLDc N-terminal domain-containing protein n=1 Tax=Okibacterium sp. HSC-33S16 TaxID=2910965 RepID=UPI0020A04B96|nr:PLDc N-terminal domain-containing protein [Okibacterium sp. HSC-33S16]MCP2031311.1 hypothetical protein [Okibacterium sp. HSC-33S16]